jgi:DNA modification methylase
MGPSKVSETSTLKNDGRPLDKVGSNKYERETSTPYRDTCLKCGAIRHDAGIGLEQTPSDYVAKMVQVFREVWRVLRDDGTAWINLGDSYNANTGSGFNGQKRYDDANRNTRMKLPELRPKNLVGIPWRVALALQADGWYLRSDIIWAKPNPMPESVTDRPTKAHEYVFLLTKRARYFYDADAVREGYAGSFEKYMSSLASARRYYEGSQNKKATGFKNDRHNSGRNRRTVWTIATATYSGAHFATFPPKLIEPMIKAGTSERGCCPECGKQWVRVTEKTRIPNPGHKWGSRGNDKHSQHATLTTSELTVSTTIGFTPTCSHDHTPIPSTVLDPFVGSGTTVQVARALGRRGIGVDLSAEYLQLARQRLELDRLDDWGKGITDEAVYEGLPLFGNSV